MKRFFHVYIQIWFTCLSVGCSHLFGYIKSHKLKAIASKKSNQLEATWTKKKQVTNSTRLLLLDWKYGQTFLRHFKGKSNIHYLEMDIQHVHVNNQMKHYELTRRNRYEEGEQIIPFLNQSSTKMFGWTFYNS